MTQSKTAVNRDGLRYKVQHFILSPLRQLRKQLHILSDANFLPETLLSNRVPGGLVCCLVDIQVINRLCYQVDVDEGNIRIMFFEVQLGDIAVYFNLRGKL